jgi:D-3-phosphoglycerate dehydrogenase / 2-oxoglutarate reductase
MNRKKTVLVTDYAWPNLDTEREIFHRVGAELLVAEKGEVEELVRLAPQADAILFNWKQVSGSVLKAASKCLTATRYGIGIDNIDQQVATELGIVVTNVPAYCIDDVADHTMGLLLACNRRVAWFDRDIKAGRYDLKAQLPLQRLRGKTLGLAGFGKIGRAVAKRAEAFGLNVIALRSPRTRDQVAHNSVERVSFVEMLARSDYLSIHLPGTSETNSLFGAAAFGLMKDGVVILNTSRGSLLPAGELLRALETGKVAAAGLDVWPQEPLPSGNPLAHHPRVVATPHAAFYSEESLLELQRSAASQVVAVLEGKMPANIVNSQVLRLPQLRFVQRKTNEDVAQLKEAGN